MGNFMACFNDPFKWRFHATNKGRRLFRRRSTLLRLTTAYYYVTSDGHSQYTPFTKCHRMCQRRRCIRATSQFIYVALCISHFYFSMRNGLILCYRFQLIRQEPTYVFLIPIITRLPCMKKIDDDDGIHAMKPTQYYYSLSVAKGRSRPAISGDYYFTSAADIGITTLEPVEWPIQMLLRQTVAYIIRPGCHISLRHFFCCCELFPESSIDECILRRGFTFQRLQCPYSECRHRENADALHAFFELAFPQHACRQLPAGSRRRRAFAEGATPSCHAAIPMGRARCWMANAMRHYAHAKMSGSALHTRSIHDG